MNPDLNKARLKLASSNEVARQSGLVERSLLFLGY